MPSRHAPPDAASPPPSVAPSPLAIEGLHHVSLPVRDLEAAQRFYEEVLGLAPLPRPPFDFAGAWYALGDQALHLIAGPGTMRGDAGVNSRDVHFAIRVRDFAGAVSHLRALGYTSDATDVRHRTRENPAGRAGFPQLFLLDPDHHVIEINAAP
jgi:catechol 2,3-dioxygenase-like lactoylglutathione lyase family enzyme